MRNDLVRRYVAVCLKDRPSLSIHIFQLGLEPVDTLVFRTNSCHVICVKGEGEVMMDMKLRALTQAWINGS